MMFLLEKKVIRFSRIMYIDTNKEITLSPDPSPEIGERGNDWGGAVAPQDRKEFIHDCQRIGAAV
jgi:hypothetical protein